MRAFGGNPGAIGQTVRLAGRSYEIIGVAPPAYQGSMRGITPSFYTSIMMVEELLGDQVLEARGHHSLFAKARLRPGVTLPQAQTALAAVAADLTATAPPGWGRSSELALLAFEDVLLFPPLDPFIRGAAWLLIVVVGLVLLLACTNLASFLLARALDRRRDLAVRIALGASRASLVRRLLIETMLLALASGSVGVLLALGSLTLLQNADLPLPVPLELDLSLDWRVLLFTLGISTGAGLALGLLPALQSTRPDVSSTLKSESAGGGQPGHLRWHNALVITQLAVSLILLVGAGLFLRGVQRIHATDPGFGREPTAIMTLMVPRAHYDPDQGRLYMQRLVERLRQVPGVTSLGVTSLLHLTLTSNSSIGFNVDGFEPPADVDHFSADRARVDPGFFDAAGIEIVRGRNFSNTDLADGQTVAIISETTARRFWPNDDAVGGVLRRLSSDDDDLVVVGVAKDTNVRTIGEAPRLMVYLPYSQAWAPMHTVLATTTMNPEQTAQALLTAGREVDPDLWVWETKTMERHLGIMRLPARLSAFILSVFAMLALALATIGFYGVVSYAVTQRTREVGIRMALGADAARIVRLLVSSGLRLVLVGTGIGLVTSLALVRLSSGLIFGGATFDPLTFVAVTLVLGLTGLVAAYLPARRAARFHPVTALRAR